MLQPCEQTSSMRLERFKLFSAVPCDGFSNHLNMRNNGFPDNSPQLKTQSHSRVKIFLICANTKLHLPTMFKSGDTALLHTKLVLQVTKLLTLES